MQLGDEHPTRFLVHARDTRFSHAFDEIVRTEGIKVNRTPIQAANANAYAEPCVRAFAPTASTGCSSSAAATSNTSSVSTAATDGRARGTPGQSQGRPTTNSGLAAHSVEPAQPPFSLEPLYRTA
jgi:hypothetical protein